MISLRVLFFVTLALGGGLAYVRTHSSWSSRVHFYYMSGDTLDIDISLLNVPPRVNHYVLYYQAENCDKYSEKYEQHGSQCYAPAKNGTIQTYEPINFTQKLDKPSITLYIELHNSNRICSTKTIMDGIMDNAGGNEFRKICLNQYDRPCEITVDFKNKCEDKIYCAHSLRRLKCESPDEELPENTEHQWYQRYSDGTSIGTIPLVKGKKSTFIISFYQFDDRTYIYNEIIARRGEKERLPEGFTITVNECKKYEVTKFATYSNIETFKFTCPNNAHTQIGWIDPKGYKIVTIDGISYSWRFRKTDNNSMLCCLHYNTYGGNVERTMDAITVLIYKEPAVKHDNVNDSTSPERHNSQETQVPSSTSLSTTSQTPKKTDIISTRGPEAPPTSKPAEKTQEQQYTEPHTNRDQLQDSTYDKTDYYIGIASVAGIIILISLIYAVIKKCCRKSSDPEQTLQLETYTSTIMELYAELDLRPGRVPPPANTEDPTYAEIIGVLRK